MNWKEICLEKMKNSDKFELITVFKLGLIINIITTTIAVAVIKLNWLIFL